MKFAFISEEKVAFSIAVLCRLLAVSPSRSTPRRSVLDRCTGVAMTSSPSRWWRATRQARAGTAARAFTPSSRPPASGWAASAWPG